MREIAQGRVWSGQTALELGLVDEIGGLSDAIAFAAEAAGLESDFRLTEFPRERDFAEVLTEALNRLQVRVRSVGVGTQIEEKVKAAAEEISAFNDPHSIYARMPLEVMLP